METVNCDYCGSARYEFVAQQTDRLHHTTEEFFSIVRCLECGLHFTNPRPAAADIARYYADGYAFHAPVPGMRRLLASLVERVANWPVRWLADLLPVFGRKLVPYVKPGIEDPVRSYYSNGGKGDFLDIGCGAGVSAHFWGASGSLLAFSRVTQVAGVEVASGARQQLASRGIESWADIDDVPSGRKFGVIRMNWSLEHVYSPSRYFEFMQSRLANGGRAIIAVPNYLGLIYRIAPDCVELPIHLYHFSPRDIENYASRYGFRIAEMKTFSYPQMFQVAAQAGMLPEAFATNYSLSEAHAFQSALARFDQAGMGNDLLVELVKVA